MYACTFIHNFVCRSLSLSRHQHHHGEDVWTHWQTKRTDGRYRRRIIYKAVIVCTCAPRQHAFFSFFCCFFLDFFLCYFLLQIVTIFCCFCFALPCLIWFLSLFVLCLCEWDNNNSVSSTCFWNLTTWRFTLNIVLLLFVCRPVSQAVISLHVCFYTHSVFFFIFSTQCIVLFWTRYAFLPFYIFFLFIYNK